MTVVSAAARERVPWREVLRGNVLAVGVVGLLTDLASEMMNPLLPLFVAGLVPVGLAPVVLGAMEGVAEAIATASAFFPDHASTSDSTSVVCARPVRSPI